MCFGSNVTCPMSVDGATQLGRGGMSLGVDILADRGQCGALGDGQWRVVEADDTQVRGHAQTQVVGNAQDQLGDQVGEARDGGGAVRGGQQLAYNCDVTVVGDGDGGCEPMLLQRFEPAPQSLTAHLRGRRRQF